MIKKKLCTNKNKFSTNAVYLFYRFEVEQGLEFFKRTGLSKPTE